MSEELIKRILRERKFIDAYIENNGNATEAYLAISPDIKRDSAKELGYRLLAKVDLSIVELLDKMGLTDPVLSQKLIEGLSATREVGTGEDKKEKLDHNVIVKYLDMALKLKAKYPADRSKLELTGKDGEPIGQTIILIKKTYEDCSLKYTGECPVREKVNLLDPPKNWDNPYDRKDEARKNV
jgi:hypothetical protein